MRTLLFIGLGLFVFSLFLPAVHGGDVVLEPEIPGWTAAIAPFLMISEGTQNVGVMIYFFSLGLGNLLLIASPYLYFRLVRKTSPWIPLVMIVTTLNSLSTFFVVGQESVLIGYFIWVLSYLTVTTSILISFFQLRTKGNLTSRSPKWS